MATAVTYADKNDGSMMWSTVLVVVAGLLEASSSRLPLIVFQHHHLYHKLEDALEEFALQTTVSPEYLAYNTDYRPLRVLYQVGVSLGHTFTNFHTYWKVRESENGQGKV